MKAETFMHRGHNVEIPAQEDAKRMGLKIDGRTHLFGRDASGVFFLHVYAYARSNDLVQVIKSYLDDRESHGSGSKSR